MLDSTVKWVSQEINGEGIGYIIHPDVTQEPPVFGTQRLMQTTDREERKKVSPPRCDAKDDKR